MEQANDVLIRGVTVAFEKDADTKKQMFENFQSEFMPKNLHVFNTQLKKNGTGFMVGKNLTAADLMLMVVLDNVLQSDPSYTSKEALADFPVVNSHYEKIKRIPAIATWNKKHPRK
jgi:glutathione S-transferase